MDEDNDIKSCSWKWQFQCPRRWLSLRLTHDPKVRSCDSCLEFVYLCETDDEVTQRSSKGQCVAIRAKSDDVGSPSDLMGFMVTTEERNRMKAPEQT